MHAGRQFFQFSRDQKNVRLPTSVLKASYVLSVLGFRFEVNGDSNILVKLSKLLITNLGVMFAEIFEIFKF